MVLDADPEVVRVAAQPMWLRWTAESGRSVRHAPDYFARRADGTGVVIDVRADERIGEQDAAVFAATGRLSAPVGWEYQWVGGARCGACGQLALAVRLPSSPVRPAGADGLAGRGVRGSGAAAGRGGRGGDPVAVLPVLFEMLWRASWPRSWNATCGVRRRWCMPAVAARAAGGTARL
jgi:hypothetical protein